VFTLEVFVAWFIGQSVPTILLAFLLGLLVGWLWWGRRRSASAPDPAAAVGWQDETVPIMGIEERAVTADVPAARTPVKTETAVEPSKPEPVTEPSPVVAPEPVAEEPAAEEPAEEPADEPVAEEPAAAPALVAEPVAEEPAVEDDVEPVAAEVFADEPVVTPTTDDNFQRIEGIGPKMNAALEQAGIRTYGQLAAAEEQTLRDAINAAGLKFAPSIVTWARQAKLLLEGDEDGLIDLQRRLVAGRDVGR
jgi:predicted flap endonuclease-1-like 5' DNA nuclease